MADYMVDHDCKRPSIANMDHRVGGRFDSRPMVNRVCLTCSTHWYGDAEAAVFQMPSMVWDRWMESYVLRPKTEDGAPTPTSSRQSPTPPDPGHER